MANEDFGSAIAQALAGGLQGFSQGRQSEFELKKELYKNLMRNQLKPTRWQPTTMGEAIEFEEAKTRLKPIAPKRYAPTTREEYLALKEEEANIAAQAKINPEQLEKESEFIRQSTQDTLDTIDNVEKGLKYFGAYGNIPTINPWGYDRKKWEAEINKLLSGKVVELITTMKSASKTGATGFGQLSEREGQLLREASTALNKGLKPADALEYLKKMKKPLRKVLGIEMSEEQNLIPKTQQIPEGYKRQRNRITGEVRIVPI